MSVSGAGHTERHRIPDSIHTVSPYGEKLSEKRGEAIDKPGYRKRYGRRIPIIEAVFADIRYCKGM
jgi:hypothetical protein